MLSSIGRAAIRRVGAGASHQSTNRVFKSVWHLQRVDSSNKTESPANIAQCSFSLQRSYATATETSKPKAKTSTTKTVAQKAATKKPAKKAVTKKPKKKVATKPKPKPKAKPKKKILTESQKVKAEIKALKAAALDPPKGKPATAWTVLLAESMSEKHTGGPGPITKEAAAKYKAFTNEELEHYNHIANQNKETNQVAYKQWIDSHSPEQIRIANNARNALKLRRSKGLVKSHYSLLEDPRLPKRPTSARFLFVKERFSTGDFKGIALLEASALIRKEWDNLSPSERKTYEDLQEADLRRYTQEFKTVFNREPNFIQSSKKAAA